MPLISAEIGHTHTHAHTPGPGLLLRPVRPYGLINILVEI